MVQVKTLVNPSRAMQILVLNKFCEVCSVCGLRSWANIGLDSSNIGPGLQSPPKKFSSHLPLDFKIQGQCIQIRPTFCQKREGTRETIRRWR